MQKTRHILHEKEMSCTGRDEEKQYAMALRSELSFKLMRALAPQVPSNLGLSHIVVYLTCETIKACPATHI